MRETVDLLCDLIRYPSTSGSEQGVIACIAEALAPWVDEVELVPITESIVHDPDYADPIQGLSYRDRHNVRAVVRGRGGGRSLLINTHADVVPPSGGQGTGFEPVVADGVVYGRGACDAKGQIAGLVRALSRLRADGTRLRGDLILHIVIEEENGGNGTLALVRTNERADGCIVLEPTDLKVVTASRGAIWFRITCRGQPGHSGSAGGTKSALKSAVATMERLEAYHAHLLACSRNVPLFDKFSNPMPLTFGKLIAGEWAATVPGTATLEGVLGFLPNRTKEEIMSEVRQVVLGSQDDGLDANSVSVEFTYRHDPCVVREDAAIVQTLKEAVARSGSEPIVAALPCSNDAWFYGNQLGIPTLVFGAGKLADAHSSHEMVCLRDLQRFSKVLLTCFVDWCGV